MRSQILFFFVNIMVRIFFGMSSRGSTPSTSSRTSSPSRGGLAARNLRLRVRAGTTYDTAGHVNVNVNDVSAPTILQSENFTGSIVVRVKDYIGVPGENGVVEDEEYFEGTRDTCSIMFGGWFHCRGRTWSVDDVVFGVRLLEGWTNVE